MKNLKCKHEVWNKRTVVSMPVAQLWASVPVAPLFNGKPFYEPVKHDIQTNGLNFPILVVKATFAELTKMKVKHKRHLLELPTGYNPTDIIYVVWGGSNRLAIARELNYTHVDCVIYEHDFAAAWRDQSLQRDPYKELYKSNRSILR